MKGKVKFLLDQIYAAKANNDPFTEKLTRTKLLVKGINVDLFDESTQDNEFDIQKVKQAAKDFGVTLYNPSGEKID